MKAEKLIRKLQRLVEENGNCKVEFVVDDLSGYKVESIMINTDTDISNKVTKIIVFVK